MKRWKFLAAVPVTIAALSLAACGGSSTPGGGSPIAPSSPSTPAAVTGATITGVVNGLATGARAGLAGARAVITVTVAGTTITATVDGDGKFVIKGVPAGTITLTFSGTPATVTIPDVGQTGEIKIVVVISGSTATVETEQRVVDGNVQLEGRISSIDAAVPGTFYVGTTLVTVPTAATIRHGETPVLFSALRIGDRVHVSGTETATGMTASLVIVQNTNQNVPVNLKGSVSKLTTTACPTKQFVVDGWTVETASSTSFEKGGCGTDLKDGANVHVKGDVQASTGRVLASWVQFTK